jgi:hypothetical protein
MQRWDICECRCNQGREDYQDRRFGRNLNNPQPELPTKQIDTTKTKKFKPGKNQSVIAAPFIPGGATVSDSISGFSELKDAAGSNGIGSVSDD